MHWSVSDNHARHRSGKSHPASISRKPPTCTSNKRPYSTSSAHHGVPSRRDAHLVCIHCLLFVLIVSHHIAICLFGKVEVRVKAVSYPIDIGRRNEPDRFQLFTRTFVSTYCRFKFGPIHITTRLNLLHPLLQRHRYIDLDSGQCVLRTPRSDSNSPCVKVLPTRKTTPGGKS
jgi:hypothetical protein